MQARGVFSTGDWPQPMPAPRFQRAATPLPPPAPVIGADSETVLGALGLSGDALAQATGRAGGPEGPQS